MSQPPSSSSRGGGRGGGRGGRSGRGDRPADSPEVALSKLLSFALRHGAEKLNLTMASDGYVDLDHLLAHPKFRQYTVTDIERAVSANEKQRFALAPASDPTSSRSGYRIKANQGHSLSAVTDLALTPLTLDTVPPVVVHGTTKAAWRDIRASRTVRIMSRLHVHCAKGLPGAGGVISGMRSASDVCIYFDVARAVADGMAWFESPNGVILSAGFEGAIPAEYWSHVTDRAGNQLEFET
ncbi:KptA family-domain-containing protein [Blastocladiella britannica]|nr:KptA family-domain-containing protein [Blastocladiella britannica]